MFLHAVGGHADRHVRLEALLHELEELVAGLLHQLLGLHFLDQFPLALFQLGDDVGEVGDDALGMLVGVEQIIDLAAIQKRGQRIERIAGIAMAGADAAAVHLGQGLGEQAPGAAERIGGLKRRLVLVPLQPAVLHQRIENPGGLLPIVAEAAAVLIAALQQGRPFQRLAEHIQHLLALERLAVIGLGAVQTLVQQPQTLGHLLAVLAGQRLEELVAVFREKHGVS